MADSPLMSVLRSVLGSQADMYGFGPGRVRRPGTPFIMRQPTMGGVGGGALGGRAFNDQTGQAQQLAPGAIPVGLYNALSDAQKQLLLKNQLVSAAPADDAKFVQLNLGNIPRNPLLSAAGTTWQARQRPSTPAGYETYSGYVGGPPDPYANLNMWSPSGGGVSAPQVPVNTLPAQVPVNTLPGSSPGGVQPPPLAQTPVGPMFYPPGPSPLGARDPRRNYLFG